MASAVDNLLRVLEIVGQAAPADPACRWFESGAQEYLQLGGPRLDEALGLRQSSNGRTPAAAWLYLRRDGIIRTAVHCCGGVSEFLDQLTQFERNEWPAVQRLTTPPKKWPALRREFFDLLRVGVPVPRGRRRLQQILTNCETSSSTGFTDVLSLLSEQDRKRKADRCA